MQSDTHPVVALTSAPWPLYNRPSIQLASLKAYLKKQFPTLSVETHHVYLAVADAVGYRVYQALSKRTWLAESVYAALLYPQRAETLERFFKRQVPSGSSLRRVDFPALVGQVREVSERFVDSVRWSRIGLLGFSICLCQFTATLYFAKRIKRRRPELPVVVGGSMFAGAALPALLKAFPQIDLGIFGEGERPLAALVRQMLPAVRVHDPQPPAPAAGSAMGGSYETILSGRQLQLADLRDLPPPDFDDYFDQLARLPTGRSFFPTLPLEMSRGCWWRRRTTGSGFTGCAFCNLNLQWDGYRAKPPETVAAEVTALTARHRVLSVAFTDNLIPAQSAEDVFERLGRCGLDLRLFCEVRADTPLKVLGKMKQAGVTELQIGIEALSTRLLKKMNKGTTAIQNLEIMKNCEELRLTNASNIIVEFPGSEPADVAETLRTLDYALPFQPLQAVRFWLGLQSPVWKTPQKFGLKRAFNHPHWSVLFPSDVAASLIFPIQSYRGDRMRQRKLWQPVRQKIAAWRKAYDALHRRPLSDPILSYRDGGDFVIVRQRCADTSPLTHRLAGTSREIYLYCRSHRPLSAILARFPGIGETAARAFLAMMVEKRLMFAEDDRYLSLAVAVRSFQA
jgi:ribosomal peptide maturation radical SAM protein 1